MKQRSSAGALEALTRRMFTRIIVALARTLHEGDLDVTQIAALYLIDEHGTMRVGEVAAAVDRPLNAVSRPLDDLVQRELVARGEDPADRRVRVLTLTPKGKAFLDRAGEDRVRTIMEATASMPAGLASTMLEALSKALPRKNSP